MSRLDKQRPVLRSVPMVTPVLQSPDRHGDMLDELKAGLDLAWRTGASALQECIVFLSFTDMTRRARVISASGTNPDTVWPKLTARFWDETREMGVTHMKADLVTELYPVTWKRLKDSLRVTKRNYFRFGIGLTRNLEVSFLEQELNANAMLYAGPEVESACLNEGNFRKYYAEKYGQQNHGDSSLLGFPDTGDVYLFVTRGYFVSDTEALLETEEKGTGAGRRVLKQADLRPELLKQLVVSGATYLVRELDDKGRFRYGQFPCFDRPVYGYNTLRHASTTYAMLEAYEVAPEKTLLEAIQRSLAFLVENYVKHCVVNGKQLAFLTDQAKEIKLGGNAVFLLACTKYTEITGDQRYAALMPAVAAGIVSMQCRKTGRFRHVLTYPMLTVKEDFRIVYYDGEATFALARYYKLCRDPRWLEAVELAFCWFERKGYWKYHDHWIAYACDVMSELTGDKRYYDMTVRNLTGYLDFVANRLTTFPTLLELMTASERVLRRYEKPGFLGDDLLGQEAFQRAMHQRAMHLMSGHFWPELAMYFRAPQQITGSFFIRHHSFRVRIDDVEHYLSALIGYRASLLGDVQKKIESDTFRH